MDLCEQVGIRSTFFVTANYAHEYPDQLARMDSSGHEVGCHGLLHSDQEEYDRAPEAVQRDFIEKATERLELLVGKSVRSFRSPRVKISSTTLRLLAEYGYWADSSVCSQRFDLISSNLINTGWLFAPRRPYRPHVDSPFKRGSESIWEVPVSAALLPFMSKVLSALGVPATKFFFDLLHAEARRTGKPIVYLSHPTEFVIKLKKGGRRLVSYLLRPRYFAPSYIRTHGFIVRNLLFRMDGVTLQDSSRELLAYMASFPDVRFVTMSEYVEQFLTKVS